MSLNRATVEDVDHNLRPEIRVFKLRILTYRIIKIFSLLNDLCVCTRVNICTYIYLCLRMHAYAYILLYYFSDCLNHIVYFTKPWHDIIQRTIWNCYKLIYLNKRSLLSCINFRLRSHMSRKRILLTITCLLSTAVTYQIIFIMLLHLINENFRKVVKEGRIFQKVSNIAMHILGLPISISSLIRKEK